MAPLLHPVAHAPAEHASQVSPHALALLNASVMHDVKVCMHTTFLLPHDLRTEVGTLGGSVRLGDAAQDPRLPQLLEALRASGRKLFLATNSLWDYTHVVMNFLLAGRTGAQKNMDWLEYFDAVITGAASRALQAMLCSAQHIAHGLNVPSVLMK